MKRITILNPLYYTIVCLLLISPSLFATEKAVGGHDTTYNPHGSDVNPRGGYTYADADAAINQPELVPRLMVGVNYTFGR